MEVKSDAVNGNPLPQRNKGGNQKNQKPQGQQQQQQQQQKPQQPQNPDQALQPEVIIDVDAPPVEKKPRFGNNSNQQGGGGGGNGGMNFQGGNNFNQGGNNFNNQGGGQNNPGRGGNFGNVGGGGGGAGGGGGGGGGGGRRSRDRRRNFGGRNNEQNNRSRDDNNRNNMGGGGGGMGGGGAMGGGGNNENNRNMNDRRSGGGRFGGGGGGGGGGRNEDFFIGQRLRSITGPTYELPPIECEESKFSGRNRLYIGNLTSDVTEEELRELFKPYGEIGEVFANAEKNFAFLKLDYHQNAEKAKRGLDGTMRKGRSLRVRFAPNATILRVKNLSPFVSNELLYRSFEIFGPIEKANVIVDDRGKHTGEGIIEFAKKSSANAALRLCSDKCFFLTASLRPCVVEPFEINEDPDGLPDKAMNKKTQEFDHERGVGPRFAEMDSFEHEYGTRWKQLYELFKTKQDALKRELKMEEDKLEAQMEYARYEHETEMLRQELRKREQDNERKKMEWENREKQAEEFKLREEENARRLQNDMQSRMLRQEEEMRRRQQENTLFMQAQQLNSLLDQQEGKQGGSSNNPGVGDGGNGNGPNFDNFENANQNNSPFDFRDALSAFAVGNNPGNAGGGAGLGPNNQQEQFSPFEFGNNQQNQNQGGGPANQRGNNGGGNNNNKPWERRRRF